MDIKELLESGVYGFKDCSTNKIVYVGSTKMSFCERLGFHLKDVRFNVHTNPKLSRLIKSRDFEFIILEAGVFDSKELLKKEKFYSDLYQVYENGYNLTVGGCRVIKYNKPRKSNLYPDTNNFNKVVLYIDSKYLNDRIGEEEKKDIIKYCNSLGYEHIQTRNFAISMTKFGYDVARLSSKRDYILSKEG